MGVSVASARNFDITFLDRHATKGFNVRCRRLLHVSRVRTRISYCLGRLFCLIRRHYPWSSKFLHIYSLLRFFCPSPFCLSDFSILASSSLRPPLIPSASFPRRIYLLLRTSKSPLLPPAHFLCLNFLISNSGRLLFNSVSNTITIYN